MSLDIHRAYSLMAGWADSEWFIARALALRYEVSALWLRRPSPEFTEYIDAKLRTAIK